MTRVLTWTDHAPRMYFLSKFAELLDMCVLIFAELQVFLQRNLEIFSGLDPSQGIWRSTATFKYIKHIWNMGYLSTLHTLHILPSTTSLLLLTFQLTNRSVSYSLSSNRNLTIPYKVRRHIYHSLPAQHNTAQKVLSFFCSSSWDVRSHFAHFSTTCPPQLLNYRPHFITYHCLSHSYLSNLAKSRIEKSQNVANSGFIIDRFGFSAAFGFCCCSRGLEFGMGWICRNLGKGVGGYVISRAFFIYLILF